MLAFANNKKRKPSSITSASRTKKVRSDSFEGKYYSFKKLTLDPQEKRNNDNVCYLQIEDNIIDFI